MKLKDMIIFSVFMIPLLLIGTWENYDKYAIPIYSLLFLLIFGYLLFMYWSTSKIHKDVCEKLGFPSDYKPSLEDLQSLEKQLLEEAKNTSILEEVRKEIKKKKTEPEGGLNS